MSGKDMNGVAKSWHQSLNTIMLTGALGIGSWCWHLLTSNASRLDKVQERQNMVLSEHIEFKKSFDTIRDSINLLREKLVREDDRLDSIEKGNHSKP